MLKSIVGENELKAKFEAYETRRTRLRECPTCFSILEIPKQVRDDSKEKNQNKIGV